MYQLIKWCVTMPNTLFCWLVALTLIIAAFLLIHFVVFTDLPTTVKQIACFCGILYILFMAGVGIMRQRYMEYLDED